MAFVAINSCFAKRSRPQTLQVTANTPKELSQTTRRKLGAFRFIPNRETQNQEAVEVARDKAAEISKEDDRRLAVWSVPEHTEAGLARLDKASEAENHAGVDVSDTTTLMSDGTELMQYTATEERDEYSSDDSIFNEFIDDGKYDQDGVELEEFCTGQLNNDPFADAGSAAVPNTKSTVIEDKAARTLVDPLTPASTPIGPPQRVRLEPAPFPPFLRTTLPQPVTSNPIIPNLHSSRRIITCFRIAEVLRATSTTLSQDGPSMFELFATVNSSKRNQLTKEQHFSFADLFFPSRPPYIRGTYKGWYGIDLFEDDTARFLYSGEAEGGKICRAIIRVESDWARRSGSLSSPLRWESGSPGVRNGDHVLSVTVVSIWEATWEDVQYTRGIVDT